MGTARRRIWLTIGILSMLPILLPSGDVRGGPLLGTGLAYNDGTNPLWEGTVLFSFTNGFISFTADVDYAVFFPGKFDMAFPGEDPSGNLDFVYAYQIHNTGGLGTFTIADPNQLSVGFGDALAGTGVENPANPGSFEDVPADLAPDSASLSGDDPTTSVRWFYISSPIPSGADSHILLYTSPIAPEFDNATMNTNFGVFDTQEVPSPIPEPSSLVLGLLAGAAFLFIARRRRGQDE